VPLDVRVLSATSAPLEDGVRGRTFRLDLYHRLALLTLRLPPLRERSGDLPLLAAHFLRATARRHRVAAPRLDDAALAVLAAHPWPGNVRELAHALEAALILGGERGLAPTLRAVLDGARLADV
jgi:DNA-binding NtrC family response regulator